MAGINRWRRSVRRLLLVVVDMAENKRFKIVDEQFISYYGGTGHKISNEECGFWLWHNKNESQKVCDKLNSILDENEQLKSTIDEMIKIFNDSGLDYCLSDNEYVEEDIGYYQVNIRDD